MGARVVLSDDEEEGQGEYEKDDFIVNDDDEEQHVKESSIEEVNTRKNKRKKRDIGEIYDDGDRYELLHEANVMSIHHPKSGNKTFRRLKKVVSNVAVDMEEQTSFFDTNNFEEGDCKGRMELKCSLFGDEGNLEKDERVQDTDVAERLQLSEELPILVPHNENTVQEAKWIYEQVFGSSAVSMRTELRHIAKLDREEVVKEIDNVLQMLHAKKFEVPFIGMYRKEMCLNLLRDPDQDSEEIEDREKKAGLNQYKALWAIQSWDRKWFLLQRRKMALKALYEKRAGEEASRDPSKWKLLGTVFQSLIDAESERSIDDIDAKFNLHFPPDEVEVEEGQFKRPKHKSLYSICRKAGLGVVSSKFGITSEQLGKNLLAMHKRHEVEDACIPPEDVAAECLAREFGDPLSVLKGARHMAAVEISCEPAVREYVRGIYMERAVVTTRPTSDGNSVIDSFHQYAGIKWLLNKPLNMFDDAQWLLIQKAEEEKLLQVTIGLPTEVIDETLMTEFEGQYLSDGVSRAAQLWNEQRKLILRDALCSYILPSMEREARMVLSAGANTWLVWDYGMQLWNKVAVAPFRQPTVDVRGHSDEDAAPRVMACCWGPGKPPTTFVMLDTFGEVLGILSAGFLSTRSRSDVHQQRKQNDQQRLSKFMVDHQPHVVVLGTACFSCKHLKDGICEVILRIVEEHPCDLPEGLDTIKVVYADEALARLYENSRISQEQLPGQEGIVRRAVALGRCLQNPLAMFAALCGPGREVLSLKLHSLEHFLSLDERYRAVEQVMITITNQVGVDVNLAASHEWMFAPLQFISGLGPRKASLLQRAISRAGWVYSRKEFIKLGAMKLCVFKNAAGFLRVRRSRQAGSGDHVMDPLDDTRIHPDSYELARKMAQDIYSEDKVQDIDNVDTQEMAVEHVKNNIKLLKALDIDEYAKSVEQQTHTKKRETYNDIRLELQHGFQDWRTPYREPSEDEEFYLLTGENDQTLAEGRIVQATVWKIQEHRVLCTLESGLKGSIVKEELSDEIGVDPTEKITEGSILTCRVKGTQKAKYMVDLTCKVSELHGDKWQWGQKDPYYAKDECSLHGEQDKVCKEKEIAKKSFKPRMIVHPSFQNISVDEAILALSDKDAGERIIRPSSRGPSYLTLSLKVYDGVYVHKDIVESGKDLRDFTSFLGLGKTLSIGEETFGDLDEVMDRYVVPLVSNLKAMLVYRNFRRGTKAEVDDVLQKEKFENPTGILYYFCVSHEYPGAFILCYIRNTNTHHEYVGLYPKGFKFRKRMFDDLDMLVDYFQTHIDDLVRDSLPPIGSATYSGAGDGGWQVGWSTGWERSLTPGSRSGANDHNHYNASDGHPSGLARPHGQGRGRGRGRGRDRGDRCGWNEERGGRFGRGRWKEGRGGGFGTSGNDSRGAGMNGRWNEDGGRRWGREGSLGRDGSWGHGLDFSTRWGQKSSAKDSGGSSSCLQGGDVWASKNEEWGSNSGNRNQDSLAEGGWPAYSGESGWNKQGGDGWDAVQGSDGWNVSKGIDTQDATSKGGASGWGTVSSGGDSGWDAFNEGGGSGLKKQGGDGWDAAQSSDGWNASKGIDTQDATSKGGASGWGTVSNGGDSGWDALNEGGDSRLNKQGGNVWDAAQGSDGWNACKGIDTQDAKGGTNGCDTVPKGGDSGWEAFNKAGDWGSNGDGGWYASNKDCDTVLDAIGSSGRGDGRRNAPKKGDGSRWDDTAKDGRGSGERKWRRDGGRGRNGRGGRGPNFNARWGQNYHAKYGDGGSSSRAQGSDVWASRNERGNKSGDKNQEWTARSVESGWNKQGNVGWDATKGRVGWNVSGCIDTQDHTSKGGTGGWDAVTEVGDGGWDVVTKVGDGGWDVVTKVGDGGWDASNKGGDTAWDAIAEGGSGDGGRDASDKRDDCMWDAATREGIGDGGGWDASNKGGDGVWDAAAKGVAVKGDDSYRGGNGKWDSKSRSSIGRWGEASQVSDDRQHAAKSNDKTSPKAIKPNDEWSGVGGMEQVMKSGTDGWEIGAGFKGGGAMDNEGTAKGWANETDGWGEVGPAAGIMNTGGRWGEASQSSDDRQLAAKSNDKRGSKAIKPNDGWSGVEGSMEWVMKSGTDGFKGGGVVDKKGTEKGWANETDGWGEVGPATGNMNTGGRWGESSQISDDWQHAAESNDKRSSKTIKPNDGWSGVEGGMEHVTKPGTDGWAVGAGFRDSGVMDNEGTEKGWANETDGWGKGEPAAGNTNTGGSGWGA